MEGMDIQLLLIYQGEGHARKYCCLCGYALFDQFLNGFCGSLGSSKDGPDQSIFMAVDDGSGHRSVLQCSGFTA